MTTPASTIVVGMDGSAAATQALDWAVREAQLRGATLEVMTVWMYPATWGYAVAAPVGEFEKWASRVADEAGERVAQLAPEITFRTEVVEGLPASVLIDASRHADLLVVGSRGRGGFTGLVLGSVSQHCTHLAHCPVVIVRPAPPEQPEQLGQPEHSG